MVTKLHALLIIPMYILWFALIIVIVPCHFLLLLSFFSFILAHNWTVSETIRWISESVELPEYVATFIELQVDGESLPRYDY